MANEPKDALAAISAAVNNLFKNTPPPPGAYDTLAGILTGRPLPLRSPPPITDRWFKDETLKIDGYTFERCRFDRCQLVTEMATFTFKHCFIAPDCGLFFVGPALKVARLLMHTLRVKGRLTVVAGEEALYAPIHPEDGTFTIE